MSATGHPGDVPSLVASKLLVVSVDPSPEQKDPPCKDPSDIALIDMMGLSESQVDTRSAGRFARASGLSAQKTGTFMFYKHVVIAETNTLL